MGMIFLRIRRGNYLTFRANRKKPHVNRRTHQLVNYQIKFSRVSWGQLWPGKTVLHGQWCVVGLSVLTHMHTPPRICSSSRGQEKEDPILPFFPFSLRDVVFSPHAQVLGFSSRKELGELPYPHDFVVCISLHVVGLGM